MEWLVHFQIAEMLPGILTQLGPEGLNQLKRLANNVVAGNKLLTSVAEEDDVPNLVENFEEVSQKDEAAKKSEAAKVAEQPAAATDDNKENKKPEGKPAAAVEEKPSTEPAKPASEPSKPAEAAKPKESPKAADKGKKQGDAKKQEPKKAEPKKPEDKKPEAKNEKPAAAAGGAAANNQKKNEPNQKKDNSKKDAGKKPNEKAAANVAQSNAEKGKNKGGAPQKQDAPKPEVRLASHPEWIIFYFCYFSLTKQFFNQYRLNINGTLF